jgi:hypothetical protein
VKGQIKCDEGIFGCVHCQPVERFRKRTKAMKAKYCIGATSGIAVVDV